MLTIILSVVDDDSEPIYKCSRYRPLFDIFDKVVSDFIADHHMEAANGFVV